MMSSLPSSTDVLIAGAGLSGLAAATRLRAAGRQVTLIDKGRGVGGRMATRRIGRAIFDHGAQFITVRSKPFAEAMQDWAGAGVAQEWCRGFTPEGDGHVRWRGAPAMTALPKHLARDLDLHLAREIAAIALKGETWETTLTTGAVIRSRVVILTAPVPQALALLAAGNFSPTPEWRKRLEAITYERCLAVLAVLNGPSQLPAPGARSLGEGPIAWLCDNQQKGISPEPCVTLHATDTFSAQHWEGDRRAAGEELLRAAAPWLGADVQEFQVHGWRYSKPVEADPEACAVVQSEPLLVLAGDAFGGPKVEGAVCSGWAAAEVVAARSAACARVPRG